MKWNGRADLSAVEDTFTWLATPLMVLKSTVSVGTTTKLVAQYKLEDRLVFSPEFIGEGGYPVPHWAGVPHPTDMNLHQTFIFGGSQIAIEKVLPFFTSVRGPFGEYRTTDPTTAELVKYMENAWIAAKVTFCNEFYDIAQSFGVSYNELRELWLTDGRVGASHTLVYPDRRGFDGKCIPKDTTEIYHAARARGAEPTLLRAVLETNDRIKKDVVY
jgi:UDPglucose 6-dehydrogenase